MLEKNNMLRKICGFFVGYDWPEAFPPPAGIIWMWRVVLLIDVALTFWGVSAHGSWIGHIICTLCTLWAACNLYIRSLERSEYFERKAVRELLDSEEKAENTDV